ncbi:37619_t:CDS:2, partial [Gigaspora margarita]
MHAIAVICYNKGYIYLLVEIRKAYGGQPFEFEDILNICIIENKHFQQNQINDHLIKLGIPCRGLLALSQGTIKYEMKVFKEIALGFTRLLYVTSKKLLLNKLLKVLCGYWYENGKLQFVIDEVYCKKDASLVWMKQLMDLIKDMEETDHAIIYCMRVKDYTIVKWNKKQICIIIAKTAFGLGIDMPDICLVIYYNFPLSMNQQDAKCVILYSKKDIQTNFVIIADGRFNNEGSDEQTNAQKLYLTKAQHQLFEIIKWCKQADTKEEILDILKMVEALCKKNDKLIIPLDMIE